MGLLGRLVAIVLIATACSGSDEPAAVADRPQLESCNGGFEVYLPPLQGPLRAAGPSRAAVDCILDAHAAFLGREAEFVVVGDDVETQRVIIQTLPDGTVNHYAFGTDWEVSEGCRTLMFSLVFLVSDCESEP